MWVRNWPGDGRRDRVTKDETHGGGLHSVDQLSPLLRPFLGHKDRNRLVVVCNSLWMAGWSSSLGRKRIEVESRSAVAVVECLETRDNERRS